MPRYVYACPERAHPRREVVHGMTEIVRVCCSTCGVEMHRVPQMFRWGRVPWQVLLDGIIAKGEKSPRIKKK